MVTVRKRSTSELLLSRHDNTPLQWTEGIYVSKMGIAVIIYMENPHNTAFTMLKLRCINNGYDVFRTWHYWNYKSDHALQLKCARFIKEVMDMQ